MKNGSPKQNEGPSDAGTQHSDVCASSGETGAPEQSPGEALDSSLRKAGFAGEHSALPHLPEPGAIVGGKYRIEERLGQGGMGAVFRARHVVSDKAVAIKWTLRSASDHHARRRFVREARVAARVDHPNVVNVYDIGQERESIYLVMELLRGESLQQRLRRQQLAIPEVVDLLLPAMRGVAAVHQAGVIHRDLKPDNIFLCEGPTGAPREAKVLDFGISAVIATEPNDPTLTRDGSLLGTPAYMSPEQLLNARDVDARTDVYAFGVILYEALTGVLPFAADGYNGLVLAIANKAPTSPVELRPDLPPELAGVILRALAKRREDRYPDIESLIAALLPYASPREHPSGDRVTAPRARSPSRHRRVWLYASAALVMALACAWWWSALGSSERSANPRALGGEADEPADLTIQRPTTVRQAAPEMGATTAGQAGPAPQLEDAAAGDAGDGRASTQPPSSVPASKKKKPVPTSLPSATPSTASPAPQPGLHAPSQEAPRARSGRISIEEL